MEIHQKLPSRKIGNNGNIGQFALFKCGHCGNIVEKHYSNGKRDESCGCIKLRLLSEANLKHGDTQKSSKYFNLYKTWIEMRGRCQTVTNDTYHRYGGRGIKVHPDWEDYSVFKEWSLNNGYIPKQKLQIDRINNDGNYEANNCRWVDAKTNVRNRSCVKLNMEKAQKIRSLYEEGMLTRDIAKIYNISHETAREVRRFKTWN